MPNHHKTLTFEALQQDVFTRFTSALLLDLNQKSTTFNTSYASPVGTEFQYEEFSFGQKIEYLVHITEYEKPNHFVYTLVAGKTKVSVTCDFTTQENKTLLTYSIILENSNIIQRLQKANLLNKLEKDLQSYADYTKKVLEA